MAVRGLGPALFGTAALAMVPASPAHSQGNDAPPPEATFSGPSTATYLPSDFVRFAPRNALDMLRQVPGFIIQQEDEARGFGEATGNILINGERLSSKTDSTSDQLARIPAGNVTRIEIVDGSSLDIPGLSGRVANIVVSTGDISGQFQWDAQLPTDFAGGSWLAGKVSVSGRKGPIDYTLALANTAFRGGSGGPSRISDAAGGLIERRETVMRTDSESPKLSGTFKIDGPGSSLGTLNLSYSWARHFHRETEDRFPASLPAAFRLLETRERGHGYEIGGDFEFALGPGRLKLIGIERFDHSDRGVEEVLDFTDGSDPRGDRFALLSDSGERVGRAEYRWRMLGGDWQLSGEGAFNRLDNIAGLFALDPADGFVEIPFPDGTGGVKEDRYEGILSYGRPITARLRMQLAVGGEVSTIAQTGINAEQRSFRRPKGSLLLAWMPQDGLDMAFELRRAVGQLDFGEFLAVVNLEDDNSNAANNQLIPPQSWEASLQLAKDFGRWGSATLKLYENLVQDYVTIVPLPEGGESVGNVDSATKRGIELTGTMNLDPLGLAGAKLDANVRLQDSTVIDPVSRLPRSFNYSERQYYKLDFRHDIPRSDLAWGVEFRHTEFAPYSRLAEQGYNFSIQTFGGLFVEHKNVMGLTMRARMANMLGGSSVLRRTVYSGPRDKAPIAFTEDRVGQVGFFWNFIVKGNF